MSPRLHDQHVRHVVVTLRIRVYAQLMPHVREPQWLSCLRIRLIPPVLFCKNGFVMEDKRVNEYMNCIHALYTCILEVNKSEYVSSLQLLLDFLFLILFQLFNLAYNIVLVPKEMQIYISTSTGSHQQYTN